MSRFNLTAQIQLQAPRNAGQVVQQIQRQLQNVNVNVNLQGGRQAQRQIQNLARSTNQAAQAGNKLSKALTASIKRYAGLAIATRAVSLFTNTLSNAIQEAVDFQRELVKVAQVTGKTLQELSGLTKEITRLSTSLGASSTALIGVSRILSQAGLSANETKIALDALARSTLAPTFDNITQTAEGAVAIFNQFRQGAEALEKQLGAINAVAGQFAVEAGDLIAVIRRTGGVFKAAGGDLNELIALFTSVRATTRESAESIATGLRTIFTRIQRPKTIEFLRQFGVELTDLQGRFVGPFEAVRRLSAALASLEQGDLQFIRIAEELGGFRQIGKVIPLIQEFRIAQEALNVAIAGGDSLTKDALTAQQALAVQVAKVKEQFLALIRNVFESTSFQLFAKTSLNIASALLKVGEALKPLIPLLTTFAAINIARGAAGLVGGLGRARGFNKGGMVPGSGNRDTVPAMLTPGEFVIRKSSVAKLGAENLAAMNQYALGGPVTAKGSTLSKAYPSLKGKINSDKEYSAKVNAIAVPTSRVIRSMKAQKRNQPSKKNWQLFEAAVASAYNLTAVGGNSYLDYPSSVGEAKFLRANATYVADKETGFIKGNNNETMLGKLIGQGKYRKGRTVNAYYPQSLSQIQRQVKEMATGGGVSGTDTVPALLTPGEFVINRASAQNIGYNNLNRMNKVGKYAAGGVVTPNRHAYGNGPRRMMPTKQRAFANYLQSTQQAGSQSSQQSKRAMRVSVAKMPTKPLQTVSKGVTKVNLHQASSSVARALGRQIGGNVRASGGGSGVTPLTSAATSGSGGGGGGGGGGGTGRSGGGRRRRDVDSSMAGFGLALTTATATLATFAPTVDENSSAQERAIAALANSATTLAATFGGLSAISESFGVSLSGAFFGGELGKKAGKKGAVAGARFARRLGGDRGAQRGFAQAGGAAARTGTQLAVGAAAFGAVFSVSKQLLKVWQDLEGNSQSLSKAIQEGNIAEAERFAAIAASEEKFATAISTGLGGAAAGMAIAGPIGAAIGGVLGLALGNMLAMPEETAVALAGAQAAAAKASLSMKKATEETTKAMEEFKAGNISAAELFKPLEQALADDAVARRKGIKAEGEAAQFGSTGVGAVSQLLGFSKSSSQIKRENEAAQKQRNEQIARTAKPVIQAQAFAAAGAGQTLEEFRGQFTAEQKRQLEAAGISIEDIFKSAEAEVERARKQFELLNLGLTAVNATAGATVAALDNLGNITDLGANSAIKNSLNTLEAGLTAAAQGIDSADFAGAVEKGVSVLQGLGASDESLSKFRNTTTAINKVQGQIPSALRAVKASFDAAEGTLGVDEIRQRFADEIKGSLKGVVDDATLSDLTELISEGELSPEDVRQLQMGNMAPLQKLVDEFGEGALKEFTEAFQQAIEIENKLVAITQQRINLENQLVSAQQKVLSAQLEAADIIAEFGGAAVTADQRRNNIVRSANVQSQAIGGITDLQSGSAAELRQRNREINAQLSQIDAQRQAVAGGEGELGRVAGTELQAQQDRLVKLAQDQYNVTKQLIDVRKQELKTIQARNAEEKKGLEALLEGDFEAFFDAQATAGASAAIATGNTQLAAAFGPAGLAGAVKNFQQMQSQGITSAYGQQIGGQGGLLEQAAGAALGTFGLAGQADVLAGTTPEEAAIQSEIRELASTLPETAQIQANAAEQLLKAALIQQQVAEAELSEIKQRVQNRAGGGLIYASRGMFVPRGTDTVPAMLTPGEFVVRRAAVQRGNNLQILKAMNSGAVSDSATQALSSGGQVRYLQNGGEATGGGLGISSETLNNFSSALNNFNTKLAENITNLQNTKFQITLNPTNINVNLTGTSFLEQLTSKLREELFTFVGQEIAQYSVGTNGKLTKDSRGV